MRIVGGEWRSRRIDAPVEGVRPTTDRVREAVFNMLMNVVDFEEITACDLFAGSGAMGIEALSRGAQHVTFVERHPDTAAVLTRNLLTLGAEARATVTVGDALEFVRRRTETFDVVFADPPYAYPALDAFVAAVLERRLFMRAFVIEHEAGMSPAADRAPWRARRFGKSAVTIYLNEEQ